jgi:ATP-binding cassette, subfamily C, bacterial CydD
VEKNITNEKIVHKKKSGMHTHRRLFALASGVHGFFPGIVLISLLIAAVVITQMYLLSIVISDVFLNSEVSNPMLLYYLAAAIAARSFLLWIRERYAQQTAVTTKSGLRKNLFSHIINLGTGYTRTGKTGEVIATLMEAVEKLDDYFTRYIPSVIHIIILPIFIIFFTFSIDWPSGLIMLITAPLILFFMWLIGTYAKKLTEEQWGQMSRLSSHFLDVLQGLKTLKIFGMNHREADNVYKSSDGFRIITMRVLKVAFISGMVLELAASISIALVAVQVGIRLIEGLMSFQPGLFVLLLAPEFYLPFRTLGLHHHAGMEGSAAAEKIFEIMDTRAERWTENIPSKKSLSDPEAGPAKNAKDLTIQFREVNFTYPDADLPVLENINCILKPGTLTAVAGPTGSGKSTFARLLLGFLQPDSGAISANNISVQEMDKELWQQYIAYVPQHPHFFNGTILENLLLAKPGSTKEEVEHAAKKSGAHSFIAQFPKGYHTPLTDNASCLSGGEKQRLAIARALLKDAPLLILDEPTSSLDPESEQIVAKATETIVKNRTTLVIAHRLRTVRNADNILVFNNGTIAESGRHDELITKKGLYASYLKTLGLK